MIYLILILRTIIVFLFNLIYIYLISKEKNKRIRKIDTINLLLTLILSSKIIINYDTDIFIYIIPIMTLLFLREFIKILLHEKNYVKNIFDNDPVILVKNSKINFKNMIKNKYDIDMLSNELKKRKIYNLDNIKYIFLEGDNTLSIVPYDIDKLSGFNPVIINGKINSNINIKEEKIKKMLKNNDLNVKDIYYALYEKNKLYIIKN